MSWSLQVNNGELSFGGSGLNTVSGGSKLTQDLACDILEPMGNDPLHPEFGSVLDGGVDSNGVHQQGVIGSTNDQAAAAFVQAEIQRIAQNYQAQQVARNQADVRIYGRATLTADEALIALTNIDIQQVATAMLVTATLQTGAGSLPLNLPFSTS